jgi:hypothetical protein
MERLKRSRFLLVGIDARILEGIKENGKQASRDIALFYVGVDWRR